METWLVLINLTTAVMGLKNFSFSSSFLNELPKTRKKQQYPVKEQAANL